MSEYVAQCTGCGWKTRRESRIGEECDKIGCSGGTLVALEERDRGGAEPMRRDCPDCSGTMTPSRKMVRWDCNQCDHWEPIGHEETERCDGCAALAADLEHDVGAPDAGYCSDCVDYLEQNPHEANHRHYALRESSE